MPLRQSLLAFKSPLASTMSRSTSQKRPTSQRTPSTSSDHVDADTIVVDTSEPRAQLPTPDESVTDVSSQSSQVVGLKEVSKGRGKRVSTDNEDQHAQTGTVEMGFVEQSRSVSGETLVPGNSPSSLVRSGITALDLPWSMSSVFHQGEKGDVMIHNESLSMESLQTMNDSEEQERLEKLAAKRVKIQEIAKTREEKQKAADVKATRRSSRASMLVKAGELVSDMASNVLGKRGRGAYEKGVEKLEDLKNTIRPHSMIEPISATTPAFEGPTSKRRRLSDGEVPHTQPRNASRRRDKRWLIQGLYAGQGRVFDARLTESKNRRKSGSKQEEVGKENSVMPLPMFAGERLLKYGRDFKLPFEVFCPLPAGQPKPDEWRKVNKNVFVGEAAEEWRETTFQEHSTCMCRADSGCDSNCMNRFMYYECDSRNCNLTEGQCGNRSFEGLKQRVKKGGKYNVGVEVIKTADRGYGVRSNRTFAPHQIIVEYTGEIINQEECEKRMNTIYKENECYYLMLFDQNMIIDATRGSIARFVNHSCEPNCKMEKWTVHGKPRMALFAGDKGIMTGDELTYDYNFDPYSQKNVQECRCGAVNCRGVLGPRPKDGKWKTEPEGKLAGAKRKLVEVIDEQIRKKQKTAPPKAPKGWAYIPRSPDTKPKRILPDSPELKPKKILLAKSKTVVLVKSPAKRATSISRRPSKLKRMIDSARNKTTSKRVVSISSVSETLLDPEQGPRPLSRSESVRAKARDVKSNIVRTVRGGASGGKRSIKAVVDDE